MSDDIDFTEIDKLIADMGEDTDVKRAISADTTQMGSIFKKKGAEAKPKPRPKTLEVERIIVNRSLTGSGVQYRPNPKTGRFMDMVRPTSNKPVVVRSEPVTRQASPPTLPPPVVTKIVTSQAVLAVEPDNNQSTADDLDIKLDVYEAENSVEATKEPSYNDIDTPFLSNVKVAKRPLGGGTAISRTSDLPLDPEADLPPVPEKKKNKLAKQQVGVYKAASRTDKLARNLLILAGIGLVVIVGLVAYKSGMFKGTV